MASGKGSHGKSLFGLANRKIVGSNDIPSRHKEDRAQDDNAGAEAPEPCRNVPSPPLEQGKEGEE